MAQMINNNCSVLCHHCVRNLETVSQHKIWYKAIAHELNGTDYIEKDTESHDMEYLEQNGYIKSTEINQGNILIKPNECLYVVSEHGIHANLYCIDPKRHYRCLYE